MGAGASVDESVDVHGARKLAAEAGVEWESQFDVAFDRFGDADGKIPVAELENRALRPNDPQYDVKRAARDLRVRKRMMDLRKQVGFNLGQGGGRGGGQKCGIARLRCCRDLSVLLSFGAASPYAPHITLSFTPCLPRFLLSSSALTFALTKSQNLVSFDIPSRPGSCKAGVRPSIGRETLAGKRGQQQCKSRSRSRG